MGRPIYVHHEEADLQAADDLECRTWRSFARRLGRHSHALRDPEATVDASSDATEAPVTRFGLLNPLSDSSELPGLGAGVWISGAGLLWSVFTSRSSHHLTGSQSVYPVLRQRLEIQAAGQTKTGRHWRAAQSTSGVPLGQSWCGAALHETGCFPAPTLSPGHRPTILIGHPRLQQAW